MSHGLPLMRLLVLVAAFVPSVGCERALDLEGAELHYEKSALGLTADRWRAVRVEILADGTFHFVARDLQEVEHAQRGAISPEEVRALLESAWNAGFFQLEERIGRPANDGTVESTELCLAGQRKRVTGSWFDELHFAESRRVGADRLETLQFLCDLSLRIERAIDRDALLTELSSATPR